MEMTIRLGSGLQVAAEFDHFSIMTDQPPASGGEGAAPTPFQLFIASLGTCAGVYVAAFCQHRGISSSDITIALHTEHTEEIEGKSRLALVKLEIRVPQDFPEKYRNSLIKTAELCAVKKAIMDPPEFTITAVVT